MTLTIICECGNHISLSFRDATTRTVPYYRGRCLGCDVIYEVFSKDMALARRLRRRRAEMTHPEDAMLDDAQRQEAETLKEDDEARRRRRTTIRVRLRDVELSPRELAHLIEESKKIDYCAVLRRLPKCLEKARGLAAKSRKKED